MLIKIAAPGQYEVLSKDRPLVGSVYQLEDAATGSIAQGKAFHALLGVYYTSRAWSYEGSGYNGGATFDEFRNMVKRKLGAGFERFIYVDPNETPTTIHDAATRQDIPPNIPSSLIRGRLKSWADYSKTERKDTIDKLIAEMHEVGVQSPKFYAILEGFERRE